MRRRGKAGIVGTIGVAVALVAVWLWFRQGSAKQAPPPVPACDRSRCPPAHCKLGFHIELAPGACCPTCVEDTTPPAPIDPCENARCVACPPGTRTEVVAGSCCPKCVDSDPDACAAGRSRYQTRRAELEVELRGCSSHDDCIVAAFDDACRASCPLALNKTRLGEIVENLREEAAVDCDRCAPGPFECQTHEINTAQCASGRCELGSSPDEKKRP